MLTKEERDRTGTERRVTLSLARPTAVPDGCDEIGWGSNTSH